jgi:hypothetical protein
MKTNLITGAAYVALGTIFMTQALSQTPPKAAQTAPADMVAAFQEWRPRVAKVAVEAEAKFEGATYYILAGPPSPPAGEKPDSSFVEEAAFKKDAQGNISRINGDWFSIPAENYIESPKLATLLNDSYVEQLIIKTGGKPKTQALIMKRERMSYPEALAWMRAGFKINPNTAIFEKGTDFPYGKAGEVLPKEKKGVPEGGGEKKSPPPARPPVTEQRTEPKPRAVEW